MEQTLLPDDVHKGKDEKQRKRINMEKKKSITVSLGPCRRNAPGVKEQLIISCSACEIDWPVEETLNDEGQRNLILNLPCPKCGKTNNIMVKSNLDILLPDGNLFQSLVTGLENPKEILFTATAQEYTLPDETVLLKINLPEDEVFGKKPGI
ncbi:hypothetical protein ACFLUN_00800 [Chloroflexota bacterium]